MMLKKKDIEVREPHDDIDGPDYSAFFFKKKNPLEFEIPNSRVRNSNLRIMAATSDEQMSLLLSTFDQIYEVEVSRYSLPISRSSPYCSEYSVFFFVFSDWIRLRLSSSEIQSNRLKLESRNYD